jgi:hypothetical protein
LLLLSVSILVLWTTGLHISSETLWSIIDMGNYSWDTYCVWLKTSLLLKSMAFVYLLFIQIAYRLHKVLSSQIYTLYTIPIFSITRDPCSGTVVSHCCTLWHVDVDVKQ